ncbi:AAA family ATPase [Fodinicola acaciae]|uniref:AAA family ATPase n=1 Tax=Fodinicola acaciae TaxID=2681555 RepID=UPI0013D1E9CD|nr:AAA family ATPase [Fodinicola acaciae]
MSVYLITGAMAAGKSTVADLLARRFDRGVHVRGDVFRRMVVSGRAEMTADAGPEALRQLALRYRLAGMVADEYASAGFIVVVQDVSLGPAFDDFVDSVRTRPRYAIVLAPSAGALAARDARRDKTGYGDGWTPAAMDEMLRTETSRRGLWLDTTTLTPDQTVDAILEQRAAALT